MATRAGVQADNNYKLITDVQADARTALVRVNKVYRIEDFEEPEQIKLDDYLFLRTGQTDADSKKLPWWRLYCGNGQFGASPAFSGKIALDDMIPVLRHGVANTDFSKMQASSIAGQNLYASFADIDDFKAVRAAVDALRARLDALVEGNATEAIDTFREIEAFLAGVTNADTLTGLLHEQRHAIDAELDVKADRSELSNVVADDEPLLPGNFPEVDVYTREELKMDLFIDMWNEAWGSYGGYDAEATDGKPFLGNGLRMSYDDALLVYQWSHTDPVADMSRLYQACLSDYPLRLRLRTLLPVRCRHNENKIEGMFESCAHLQSLSFMPSGNSILNVGGSPARAFARCSSLESILTPINISYHTDLTDMFRGCTALEHVEFRARDSVSFADSSKLSLHSMEYIAQNYNNDAEVAITLHPDAFARLTEEVMEQAAARQITFVTA